jgi:hypothetical protein
MVDVMKKHAHRAIARAVAVATCLLAALSPTAFAADARVQLLDLPAKVSAVRQSGSDVFVLAGTWRKLFTCEAQTVCTTPGKPPGRVAARDGIPHGAIAKHSGRGIRQAWYTQPTGRYGHGVLGDRIEGGGLAVIDERGRRHDMTLARTHVFEDLTPRIADLDGDSIKEVVTIRSDTSAGAAIAVYEMRAGKLVERASIPPIGLAHRWLNIAGIADYTGDGRRDIAIIKTPHIGGRYELWTLEAAGLVRIASTRGFSNHTLGSRELGLSATADVDGDGVVDLVVPDARRASLRVLSAAGGTLREITRIDLPARVATALGVLAGAQPVFVAGLDGGRLAVVRP